MRDTAIDRERWKDLFINSYINRLMRDEVRYERIELVRRTKREVLRYKTSMPNLVNSFRDVQDCTIGFPKVSQ